MDSEKYIEQFETIHHIAKMGIFWKSTGIENQNSHHLGVSHFSQRSENEKSHLSQLFSQSVSQSDNQSACHSASQSNTRSVSKRAN